MNDINLDHAINTFIARNSNNIVMRDNNITLMDIRKKSFFWKQLSLSYAHDIYCPTYLLLEQETYRITVFYEMSYAGFLDDKPIYTGELLHKNLPDNIKLWISQQFMTNSAEDGVGATHINIHDLIYADAIQQEKWLANAVSNSLHYVNNRHDIDNRLTNALSGLFQVLLKTLPDVLKSSAINACIRFPGNSLYLLSDAEWHYAQCDIALSSHFGNIRFIPNNYLVKGLYRQYAFGKPDALALVASNSMNIELARIAIHCHPKALLHLSLIWHSNDIYEYALREHAESIAYIPKQYINEKLCIFAVEHHVSALEYIPAQWLTGAVLQAANDHDHNFLYFVPFHLRSLEVCRMAVAIEPESISFVPQIFIRAINSSSKPT